jgi:hypothetical protein
MKCLTHILPMICLFTFSSTYAQETKRIERDQFVKVPREVALPVVVFQPGSAMKFESIERLLSTGGGGANIYQLRNIGTKPIRRYLVSYMFVAGTGGSWEWTGAAGDLILPGQLAPFSEIASRVIPLTDALRDKLGLRSPMKTVIFYMVERVEFVDGSTYTDEFARSALKNYLDNVADKVYQNEQSPAGKGSQ